MHIVKRRVPKFFPCDSKNKKQKTKNKKQKKKKSIKWGKDLHNNQTLETLDHFVSMSLKSISGVLAQEIGKLCLCVRIDKIEGIDSIKSTKQNLSMISVPKATSHHTTCRVKRSQISFLRSLVREY